MKRSNVSKAVLAVLVCLGLYLSFHSFFHRIQEKKNHYQKVKENFSQEVSDSFHLLSFNLSKVLFVLKSEKNFDPYDQNVSRRIFTNHLKMTELDEIQIFTDDCKLIWTFSLLKRRENECTPRQSSRFSVYEYKTTPLIALTIPIVIGAKNYLVQGSFHMGKTWLSERPLLGKSLKDEALYLSAFSNPEKAFSYSFFDYFGEPSGKSQSGIFLHIENIYFPVLNYFFTKWTKGTFFAGEVILLLCLLILLRVYFEERRNDREKETFVNSFENWCQNSLMMTEKELYTMCLKKMREDKGSSYQRVYKVHSEILANKLQKTFSLQNKLRDSEKKNLAHERESLVLSHKTHIFTLYDFLKKTIPSFVPVLTEHLKRIQSETDHVDSTIKNKILEKLNFMNFQFKEWEKGGKTVGLRKYLRSLSETNGSHSFVSMLEEQVSFFVNATGVMIEDLEKVSVSLEKLREEKKPLDVSFGFWSDFLTSELKERNVRKLLEGACELVRVQNESSQINLDKLDERLLLPKRGEAAKFVASSFQILSYLEANSYQGKISISSARESGKIFLFFSSEGAHENGKKTDNLKSSEELLHFCGVQQKHLNVDGVDIFSFEWSLEESKDLENEILAEEQGSWVSARAT